MKKDAQLGSLGRCTKFLNIFNVSSLGLHNHFIVLGQIQLWMAAAGASTEVVPKPWPAAMGKPPKSVHRYNG